MHVIVRQRAPGLGLTCLRQVQHLRLEGALAFHSLRGVAVRFARHGALHVRGIWLGQPRSRLLGAATARSPEDDALPAWVRRTIEHLEHVRPEATLERVGVCLAQEGCDGVAVRHDQAPAGARGEPPVARQIRQGKPALVGALGVDGGRELRVGVGVGAGVGLLPLELLARVARQGNEVICAKRYQRLAVRVARQQQRLEHVLVGVHAGSRGAAIGGRHHTSSGVSLGLLRSGNSAGGSLGLHRHCGCRTGGSVDPLRSSRRGRLRRSLRRSAGRLRGRLRRRRRRRLGPGDVRRRRSRTSCASIQPGLYQRTDEMHGDVDGDCVITALHCRRSRRPQRCKPGCGMGDNVPCTVGHPDAKRHLLRGRSARASANRDRPHVERPQILRTFLARTVLQHLANGLPKVTVFLLFLFLPRLLR